MDGRERDGSQLYRSNIKRPWDEDATVSKTLNSRHDARLPPIESGRAQGTAIHSGAEQEDGSSIFSQTDSTKRRRFEGHSYDYISGETISSSTRRPGSRSSCKCSSSPQPQSGANTALNCKIRCTTGIEFQLIRRGNSLLNQSQTHGEGRS